MSLLPGCRDLARTLSDARDTGRPLGLRALLHLWICAVCRRLRDQLALLGDLAKKAPEDGPSLSEEAKARLRRTLSDR